MPSGTTITTDMCSQCQGSYEGPYEDHECEQCGETATHLRIVRESCPTDRGEEIREFEVWFCEECDPQNLS